MSSVESAEPVREDANHEPCPTPLNWRQVLATFREQSRNFEVAVAGHTLACRSFGRGPSLYFVNGMTGNSDLFSLLAYVLADEFECVFYDLPDSVGTPSDVPTLLSGYLLAVADARNESQIDVFSAGFGCVTALTAALQHPDRIGRLVLQSAFANREVSLTERLLSSVFRNSHRAIGTLPLWARINERNHQMWFPPFDGSRWEFLDENLGSTPLSRVTTLNRAYRQFDMRGQLDHVGCPTLLISTEGDGRVLEASLAVLESGLANSQTELMDNTGHFAFLTHPHRLKKQLKQYLLDS